ncbi:cytochrome P450 [Paxillus ammoniavirescens]|nr:cytochrome P450 [Paxillus ammoniavirescens]
MDVSNIYTKVSDSARRLRAVDAALALTALWAILTAVRAARRRLKTTQLRGPPNPSLLYGVGKDVAEATDSGALMYEAWAEEYGVVYQVPSTLGQTKIVLTDPRAIAHFYARETWTYVLTPLSKALFERGFGRGLLWSQGESHRRQRKSLTPAFSNAAIRKLAPIFYDSVYKAKGAWDALIEAEGNDSAVIEVQSWMNHISLDSIGIAGFSHDFGSLDGKKTSVTEVFDAFGHSSSAINVVLLLLSQVFPFITRIPTSRSKLISRLNKTIGEISMVLLDRTRQEKELGIADEKGDHSIIGLLIKGESKDAELHLSHEEIMAQMKVLLLAGYETTSVSLTWALIQLAQNPAVQTKLREELLLIGGDPTYEQLTSSLPYLDAVVHETLRVHPPLQEFTRVAAEDDVIPLSQPVRTKSGKVVDHISVAKDTLISINVACINRSAAIWGPDAKVWKPERWLEEDGIPKKAQEVQGHRHLLTFVDGPRTCLGKNFSVTEFKTVLSVLVKNFVFELRDGPETKLEIGRGILPRPKLVGENGTKTPLRVRRFEA